MLLENKDYRIEEYRNNIDEGIGIAVICGIGNYAGEIEYEFEILSKDSLIFNVEMDESDTVYDGTAHRPEIVVIDGLGNILTKEVDYSLEYDNNIDSGYATVKIKGNGFFAGTISRIFKISSLELDSIDIEYDSTIYSGHPCKPLVIVKNADGVILEENTEYTVRYEDNINVGIAKVQIEGIGNYTGKYELEYVIEEDSIENFEISLDSQEYYFAGKKIEPIVTVQNNYKKLRNGVDFTVIYSNNENYGFGLIRVEGRGNYKGIIEKNLLLLNLCMSGMNIILLIKKQHV